MSHDEEPSATTATKFISVRVTAEQKDLVEKAATREGLYISNFIIVMLVRLKILPPSSIEKIKRRPVSAP